MAVHVENLTSRVTIGGTEVSLTEEQLTRLVDLVAARLRTGHGGTDDTEMRRSVQPPAPGH